MNFASRFRRWLLLLPVPLASEVGCVNCPNDVHQNVSLADAKQRRSTSADAGPPLADVTTVTDANCAAVCQAILDPFDAFKDCQPAQGGQAAACHFTVPCTGRVPPHLTNDPRISAAASELGALLAEAAYLEAASIHAFVLLERELRAHGAPRSLVRAAGRATRDEVRHARAMAALARRHGATPRAPRVDRSAVRPLAAIAEDNAAEGCVRETWGAVFATYQALTAADPELRAAFAEIARDETCHAELAWRLDRWLSTRLSSEELRNVERARRAAIRRLRRELRNVEDIATPSSGAARAAGFPSPEHARVLLEAMRSDLWPAAA